MDLAAEASRVPAHEAASRLRSSPSLLPDTDVSDLCKHLHEIILLAADAAVAGRPLDPKVKWADWLWRATTGESNRDDALAAIDAKYGVRRGPCDRQWGKGNQVFRCLDCQKMPAMAMCPDCFYAGPHSDHHIKVYLGDGGSCDCGNPEMMQEAGFCPSHGPSAAPIEIVPEMQGIIDVMTACFRYIVLDPGHAQPLLSWVLVATSSRDVFRAIGCQVMLSPEEHRLPTDYANRYLRTTILRLYPENMVEILVNLLLDPHFKHRFYPVFIAEYHHVASVIASSSDGIVDGSSASKRFVGQHAKLTSQLFACGDALNSSMEFETVATTLFGCLETVLRGACRARTEDDQPISEPLVIDHRHRVLSARLYWVIVADLGEYLRSARIGLFLQSKAVRCSWLRILSWLEWANPQHRVRDEHVLYDDPLWSNTLLLDLYASRTILGQMQDWLSGSAGPTQVAQLSTLVDECLATWASSAASVSQDVFSGHHPLLHTISFGLAHLHRMGELDTVHQLLAESAELAMSHALRVFAVKSQFRNNEWVLNGEDMYKNLHVYVCSPGCNMNIDLDIHLVQLAPWILGAGPVVAAVVEAFDIKAFLLSPKSGDSASDEVAEAQRAAALGRTEDALVFLIVLLTNRTWIDHSPEAYLRKEVRFLLRVK